MHQLLMSEELIYAQKSLRGHYDKESRIIKGFELSYNMSIFVDTKDKLEIILTRSREASHKTVAVNPPERLISKAVGS